MAAACVVRVGKESVLSALISILRAVHCRSTHHFFAVDALERIDTPNGRRLASVLLAHYGEYLRGAKDPDTKFKDFQNHVIHVSDNNWGGAAKACETWLVRSIEDLHNSDWAGAAYSLGVLSHYFTDPFMPLHTAQHPSEAVVHRPLEWSICKSYDRIFRRCTHQVRFPIEAGPGWLAKAVLAGAEFAHKHYLPLIEYYDLNKGSKDPPAGLDSRSREILTEIFDYALTGWARILDRIAALAVVEIPICPLTFTTVMATVDVPSAWVLGRISDAVEQRAVKAIFDEYQATGKVVKNVPPEVQAIASIKPPPEKQAMAPMPPALDSRPSIPFPPTAPVIEVREPDAQTSVQPLVMKVSRTKVVSFSHASNRSAVSEHTEFPAHLPIAQLAVPEQPKPKSTPAPQPFQADDRREALSSSPRNSGVNLDSDLVDAPSIGPKTAARFYQLGINTIGDFLAASPAEMASQLDVSWIDESVLVDWQDQARLVVQVPALCGYKAQLLVGVDYRTAQELAAASGDLLHNTIREYCRSEVGSRIIRSATVPSREEVAKWIQSAAQATTRVA